MPSTLEKKIFAGFAISLVVLLTTGAIVAWSSKQYAAEREWVPKVEEALGSLRDLLSTMINAETAVRGYTITGDAQLLEPFNRAQIRMDRELEAIAAFTTTAEDKELLSRLKEQSSRTLQEFQTIIEARQKSGFEAAKAAMEEPEAKLGMRAIWQLIDQLEQGENGQLSHRNEEIDSRARWTVAAIWAGGVVSFLAFGVMLRLTIMDARERRRVRAGASRFRGVSDADAGEQRGLRAGDRYVGPLGFHERRGPKALRY